MSIGPDSVGVVFGGSSGIGRATAMQLAPRVGRLYCCSRRGTSPGPADADAAADAAIVPVGCDIRRYDEVGRAFDRVGAECGRVDFVVNSVGVGYYAPLDGAHSDLWEDTLQTNVVGLLNVLSWVNRLTPAPKAVVHVGSVAALRPSLTPGSLVYSVSKLAGREILDAFRRDLRRSGRLTRITHVAPGLVAGTGFAERYYEHSPDLREDLYDAHRNLSCDDVARAIVDLLAADEHVDVSEMVVRPVEQPT